MTAESILDPWRSTLLSLTELAFPRSRRLRSARGRQLGTLLAGEEQHSNLPLQVSLFFNTFYSPIWIVACIIALSLKFSKLSLTYKVTSLVIYVLAFLTEALRLYLGFAGNLTEKVPELAGCWLLTVIQLPMIIYLISNDHTNVLPLERAVLVSLLPFILAETVLCYRAVQRLISSQIARHQLNDFDVIDQPDSRESFQLSRLS